MRRSALENKYYKNRLSEPGIAFKKHKNYTKRLIMKEKKKYFSNLNLNNYTDNKRFWQTVKPLFSSGGIAQQITLVENDDVITSDKKITETFNTFFIEAVDSLELVDNRVLQTSIGTLTDPVKIALKRFEDHPSIIDIKEKVTMEKQFSFSLAK